jgi:hypothetical protein
MANGFAPYLLKDLLTLSGQNYPGLKLTQNGFLGMLLENSNVVEAKLTNSQGHQKTAKVKYKTRQTTSTVVEDDNCDIDFTPVYKEADMTAVRFAKTGFHLSMETVSKYMESASAPVGLGSITILQEIANSIQHTANAIVSKVNGRLLSDVVWGENIVEGDNNATAINISKNPALNLSDGISKILSDAFENNFSGQLLLVGNGLMNSYELSKGLTGLNQAGLDISKFTGYKFYADLLSKNEWGANQVGVFAPGSIHLVDFQKYVGFQAGQLGTSYFDQIDLNVSTGTGIVPMTFDVQIKAIDCPTTLLNGYGEEGVYDRGYAVILSKRYGLFQTPADAFGATDELSGVNGALRYVVSNDCDVCAE